MTGQWQYGNAIEDGRATRGWLTGHFIDPGSVRSRKDVEVKWAIHPLGDTRAGWTVGEQHTTMVILVDGMLPGRACSAEREHRPNPRTRHRVRLDTVPLLHLPLPPYRHPPRWPHHLLRRPRTHLTPGGPTNSPPISKGQRKECSHDTTPTREGSEVR